MPCTVNNPLPVTGEAMKRRDEPIPYDFPKPV